MNLKHLLKNRKSNKNYKNRSHKLISKSQQFILKKHDNNDLTNQKLNQRPKFLSNFKNIKKPEVIKSKSEKFVIYSVTSNEDLHTYSSKFKKSTLKELKDNILNSKIETENPFSLIKNYTRECRRDKFRSLSDFGNSPNINMKKKTNIKIQSSKKRKRLSSKGSFCIKNLQKNYLNSQNSKRSKTFELPPKSRQRSKRNCIFDLGFQKKTNNNQNNIVPIGSKKMILKYLNRKLNDDPTNYYNMHTTIIIENLIQNYPNYLNQFKQISKDNFSKKSFGAKEILEDLEKNYQKAVRKLNV